MIARKGSHMTTSSPARPPLSIDTPARDAAALSNAVEDLYERRLDVAVVRQAWGDASLAEVAASLDGGTRDPGWNRPNAMMPPEDIQVLGTAATPTYSSPAGPTLDRYLEDAG